MEVTFNADRTKVIYKAKSYSIRRDHRKMRYFVPAGMSGMKMFVESQLEVMEIAEGKKPQSILTDRSATTIRREIKEYRKGVDKKYLSTSHEMTDTEFTSVHLKLLIDYKDYNVERIKPPRKSKSTGRTYTLRVRVYPKK